jgi:hypothetical protein
MEGHAGTLGIRDKDRVRQGLGTCSMKRSGEVILGGRIDFSSSAEKGTTFRLALNARRQLKGASEAPAGH